LITLFGAIDLGAGSGRVMAGEFVDSKLRLQEIHRFPNSPIQVDQKLVWDFDPLFAEIKIGLRKLVDYSIALGVPVSSVAVDSWAVDYGLVADGALLTNPSCYRDPANNVGVAKVHEMAPFETLYASSGIQFLPFNSIYQLARQQVLEPELVARAEHVLLLPDLVGYFLTGKLATERTNASSTGLLCAISKTWDLELASRVGIQIKFPSLQDAGFELGQLLPGVIDGLEGCKVVLVGSHDTASAVVGVPSGSRSPAFLSSGTWSLLGAEIQSPILTEASRRANFSNELGVDGRVRYLKNLSGLWLLSESIRHFSLIGEPIELADLIAQASKIMPLQRIDVSDPLFMAPGDMPNKIAKHLADTHQPAFENLAELAAIVLHSLARSYAENLLLLEELTGLIFSTLHIIGGGSQNSVLNQLTANYTKRRVVAGPVEATAIGNILIQARAHGILSGDLEQLRKVILDSKFDLQIFLPEN